MLAGGPIGLSERAVCHVHCRQTPSSPKLCIFSVAARHCLKRMERLQYIMQSCGCFLSLLVFHSYVCLFDFSFLLRSLLRFIILSWFHPVFFFILVPVFVVFVFFFFCLSYVSFLIGGLKLLCLELDKLNDAGDHTIIYVFQPALR